MPAGAHVLAVTGGHPGATACSGSCTACCQPKT